MNDPLNSNVLRLSLTNLLAQKGSFQEQLDNLRVYAENLRYNAALICDLAGAEEGQIQIERQNLFRAMSTQVYLAEGMLIFLDRAVAIAGAAEQPNSTPH